MGPLEISPPPNSDEHVTVTVESILSPHHHRTPQALHEFTWVFHIAASIQIDNQLIQVLDSHKQVLPICVTSLIKGMQSVRGLGHGVQVPRMCGRRLCRVIRSQIRVHSDSRWIATTIPAQPGLLSRSWLRARANPLR